MSVGHVMPPSHSAFNWLCVLCSTVNILAQAARLRAAQVAPKASIVIALTERRQGGSVSKSPGDIFPRNQAGLASHPRSSVHEGKVKNSGNDGPFISEHAEGAHPSRIVVKEAARGSPLVMETESPLLLEQNVSNVRHSFGSIEFPLSSYSVEDPTASSPENRVLQASKVPSSRIGRLFHYGGLAASMGYGVGTEMLRRLRQPSSDPEGSMVMTEANIKRLVEKLSKMRGAALKLGQFLSIQDTHVLPPTVDEIFRRVQDSAHYMPDWQIEQVLIDSLGPDWSAHFTSFTRTPFAAASIGQVHSAVLSPSSSPTGKAAKVAVKVQFPSIADSISSDVGYVKLLLLTGRLLPKGLFLDRTLQVMKQELADECDYTREAKCLRAFASHLEDSPRYKVPWVWDGSTDRVLVMEHIDGLSVGDAAVNSLSQADRNDIATRVVELCLRELFQFQLMQTDPNWTNFLWNAQTRQLGLIDFGATREYSKVFMDKWLRLLTAAAAGDRDGCVEWSLKLGYLTGDENEIMLDAHVTSMMLLAMPFKATTSQPFVFGRGTEWADITARIRGYIPVMLKHRLTPPPRETYSLNRKLSGAFLLASRLGAVVDTKSLWDSATAGYKFDP